ncbi:MAG: sulfite exporter TauE/SafE family protein [Anaerolineae bacterium]|nr:sulfite exporter TauE/SafE family protein [Anaerolineae bacterium]
MTTFFIMTAVVIFIIGLGKGGLGGTLGVLATPLMSLVMPADQVIGLLLPILIIADIFAVYSHWGHWDTKLVVLLIPGAIVGMVIASFFIAGISPEMLKRGIGVVVLLFVVYKLLEQRIMQGNYTPRSWHGFVAGAVGGISSTLAHTGGPPIAIYLLMQDITPRVFVATSALFFAVLNWLKVPSYYFLGLFDFNQLWQVAWLLPLLPLSVWIGKLLATKVNKVLFDRIIVALLAITALFLLFD